MSIEIEQALTAGLIEGYAGGDITQVDRDGFMGKASHVEGYGVYHDEWFTGELGSGKTYSVNRYIEYLSEHRIPVAVKKDPDENVCFYMA